MQVTLRSSIPLRFLPLPGLLLLACLLAGCFVKVDKSNGDKDVSIHTPMGGLQVHKNGTTPQDIGLPSYPGATVVSDDDGSSSADVHVGFGEWQLHVRAAKYQSSDPQARITDFYRSALGRFGEVLECRHGHAVGSPTVTRDGLSCQDKGHGLEDFHIDEDHGVELRAGSKRHQHVVSVTPGDGGGSKFALVMVDLPAALEHGDKSE